MNEQTAKLLEQLAAKLGTTSEYLWSILLKQAPVAATITLSQILFIYVFGFVMWRWHKHCSNDKNEMSYYNNDAVGPVIVVGFILFALMVLCSLFMFADVLNGYLNPEFWALDYIIGKLKQ